MPINQDFETSRRVLDFRPDIGFVEPEQLDIDPPPAKPTRTIEEAKKAVQNAIDSYRKIEVMADLAQKRIDTRARGFQINLDPVADAHVIDAIKCHFPNKTDPTKITFDDYRNCIETLSERAREVSPIVDPSKVALDASRVDFGGLGLPDGLNRPDLDKDSQIVPPLDLGAFKAAALVALFAALLPSIKGTILTTPHVASTGTVAHVA